MDDTASGSSSEFEGSSTSAASDRPNRWQGPKSTWQTLNQEEIGTLTALNELRNRDLATHLYNAFALKRRHRHPEASVPVPAPDQDIDVETNRPVNPDDWLPHRAWTAWPVRADRVPPADLLTRTKDADERLTIRKSSPDLPSAPLEEAVAAVILRHARLQFEARPLDQDDDADDDQDAEDHDDDDGEEEDEVSITPKRRVSKSRSSSRVIKQESESEGERMVLDTSEPETKAPARPTPEREPFYQPVVSTDDDFSSEILRPTVRHILAKLDTTLTILHNAREAAMGVGSESDDSDSSAQGNSSPIKRGRGRPRKAGPVIQAGEDVLEGINPEASPKRRVGRPPKVYQRLPGESRREHAVRVARMRKKPIPKFIDGEQDEDEGPEDEKSSHDGLESVPGTPRTIKQPKFHEERQEDELDPSEPKRKRGVHGTRLHLRDWTDVLGAAALAGFPPQALDRAARRCAELFGQQMELRTMYERPSDAVAQVQTTLYKPGMDLAPEEDIDYLQDDGTRTRASSAVAEPLSADEEASARGRSRSNSRARSRSRSRSASAAGTYFCQVPGCIRGQEGFGRRGNLLRHMRLVHHVHADELPNEVDSEDEMHGAVHVDGFMKPIKIRRGWRGEDSTPQPRRRTTGRRRPSSSDGDIRMGNVGVDSDS